MRKIAATLLAFFLTSPAFGTSTYSRYPGYGSFQWKSAVASVAALPGTQNVAGDVRMELTAFGEYVWNGSAWVLISGIAPQSGPLTGDVTTPSSTNPATTVAKIQGVTVSGTTGTTNVVFSNSPTLTGSVTDTGDLHVQEGSGADVAAFTNSSLNIYKGDFINFYDNSNVGMVGIFAPASVTSYDLKLPSAQGGANTLPLNDGSGNLSWLGEATGNTASTLVARDSSGNFSAGTITASVTGHASLDVPLTQVGAANGVCPLDASSKVPTANLPSTVFEFQGSWNPNTNSPALADNTGTAGNVYYVSAAKSSTVSGLADASMSNFQIGDLVIYSAASSKWELSSPAAGVQSVNGSQGAVTVNAINQLTGDVTAGPASGSASAAATLASSISGAKTFSTSLTSPVFISSTSNAAGSGQVRLANADSISWRNSGNSGDYALKPHADGILQYNGNDLTTNTATQTLTNKTLDTGGTNLIGSTTISGATGSGNVVFSASPTLTGATTAGSIAMTSFTTSAGSSLTSNAPQLKINADTTAHNPALWFLNAASSGHYNFKISNQDSTSNALEITASSGTDGTTWATPIAKFNQSGTVTIPGLTTAGPVSTDSSGNLSSAATITSAMMPALTGDVTSSAGSTSTTIAAGAVTLAKHANLAANSIMGNNTGSPAAPLALTASQVNTLLGSLSNPMTTGGDLIYGGSSGTPTRLANGSLGQTLMSNGSTSAPSWTSTNTQSKTGNYTTVASDDLVVGSTNGGAFTVTLIGASSATKPVRVCKGDTSSNLLTISRGGTDTIQGSGGTFNTTVLHENGSCLTLTSDGSSKWYLDRPERTERMSITGTSSPSVASQSGSWISLNSHVGAGDNTWTIPSGVFSGTPTCNVTPLVGSQSAICEMASVTSTAIEVKCGYASSTAAGYTLTDYNFGMVCTGPR